MTNGPENFGLCVAGLGPSDEHDQPTLIAVENGTLASMEPESATTSLSGVIDYSDSFVVPLLVDTHAHVVPGLSKYGVVRDDPDVASLLSQGDAGPANVGEFIARSSPNTVFAISLASHGEASAGPSYDDPNYLDVDGVREAFDRYGHRIWGISVNLNADSRGSVSSDLIWMKSLQIATELGVPMILGTGQTDEMDISTYISELRAGDILTYLFRGGKSDVFATPALVAAVGDAQARGVTLDASHGASSFDFEIAARAMSLGILPDTVSSDLSTFCADPTESSLAYLVGKLVALGVDPQHAVSCVTDNAAEALRVDKDSTTISIGNRANFLVVRWSDRRPLNDTSGNTIPGRVMEVLAVVRSGRLLRRF